MKPIRYGVQVEFTVDSILDGGPSKAEIRKFMREAIELRIFNAKQDVSRFNSLRDVRIKYLHEATTPTPNPKVPR